MVGTTRGCARRRSVRSASRRRRSAGCSPKGLTIRSPRVLAALAIALFLGHSRTAAALDKQGSAHGGAVESGEDDDKFDVEGALTLGTALAPIEVHLAYERDMPVDQSGFVQSFIYALMVYDFDLRRALPPPLETRGAILSP